MTRTMTVSDSIVINASRHSLYDGVSDPTQMGTWSPENRGATLAQPGDRAHVGMDFDGTNKRGRAKWTTRCTVTAADENERFEFRVHAIGLKTPRLKGPIATWRYDFEDVAGGTKVTETWVDARKSWPEFAANAFDKIATGTTFAAFQQKNIHRTLNRLKETFESTAS